VSYICLCSTAIHTIFSACELQGVQGNPLWDHPELTKISKPPTHGV